MRNASPARPQMAPLIAETTLTVVSTPSITAKQVTERRYLKRIISASDTSGTKATPVGSPGPRYGVGADWATGGCTGDCMLP